MVPGTRLVILGRQGAGKGTQCVRLSHHYVVAHISTGDMLRAAIRSGSQLGQQVRLYMDSGELIPDEVVVEMVAQRVKEDDTTNRGFVLDGFPRTIHQAEALDEMLRPGELDLVIDLEVPREVVTRRLGGRRVCMDCGANYSLRSRPQIDWTCDVCGGEVVQREDDTEAAIRRRLDLYDHETAPLIEWYRDRDKLVTVSGRGQADAVTARLVKVVDGQRSGGR